MAELSYTSYDYVGPVLDEGQFYELKGRLPADGAAVEGSLQVKYLKEIWRA